MERLVYKLDAFEGPLDALLFLISKNKLNIYDIPISQLLEQYLGYLAEMREMNLEIESEFLEMASRLVQIKSAMLLPKRKGEEENDPRKELVMALIEYKTCKAMAESLKGSCVGFDCYVREPAVVEHDETYKVTHDKSVLYKAFLAARGRGQRRLPPPVAAFRAVIDVKFVPVTVRIIHVIRRLIADGQKALSAMFDDSRSRSEAVATFLAVLELIKSRKIAVDEDGETVRIVRSVR